MIFGLDFTHWSEWALGFVYEKGVIKEGIFFYPDYGVAIEMSFNSIWY